MVSSETNVSVCNDTYVALGGGDILAIAENPQSAKKEMNGEFCVEALRDCERVRVGSSQDRELQYMQCSSGNRKVGLMSD